MLISSCITSYHFYTSILIAHWLYCSVETSIVSDNCDALYEKLFLLNKYNKHIIPKPDNGPLPVTMYFMLKSVLDVNEHKQSLSVTSLLTIQWSDDRLEWDPDIFGGITRCYFHQSDIWIPDVFVDNASGEHSAFISNLEPNIMAIITNTGDIVLSYPLKLTTVCGIDTSFYPYDTQICEIIFGNFMYADEYVNLTWYSFKSDSNTYEYSNPTWTVQGIDTSKTAYAFVSDIGTYTSRRLELMLSRKISFTALAIIIPCVMLTILTLLIFLLPPHSGEKLNLGVAIWTSLVVFLLILVDLIPGSSGKMPLIGIYNLLTLVLVTLSLMLSVAGAKLIEADQPIPLWIQNLMLNYVAKITFWKHGLDPEWLRQDAKSVNLVGSNDKKHSPDYSSFYQWNENYDFEGKDVEEKKISNAVPKADIRLVICQIFDRLCFAVQLVFLLSAVLFMAVYYTV